MFLYFKYAHHKNLLFTSVEKLFSTFLNFRYYRGSMVTGRSEPSKNIYFYTITLSNLRRWQCGYNLDITAQGYDICMLPHKIRGRSFLILERGMERVFGITPFSSQPHLFCSTPSQGLKMTTPKVYVCHLGLLLIWVFYFYFYLDSMD